jgi:hypothetical protein
LRNTCQHEGPFKYSSLSHIPNFHIFTTPHIHCVTMVNFNSEDVLTIGGRIFWEVEESQNIYSNYK